QDGTRAVAVLDAGGVREQDQRPAVGVDEGVALAALDPLAGIIAARPSALAGLDRLAVDDRGRGRGFPAAALAVQHQQPVVDLLEHALVAEATEPPENRASRRKVARQQP